MDFRAGLADVENRKFLTLQGLELRPVRRPARSQSLYRLRYPGSIIIILLQLLLLLFYHLLSSSSGRTH
jgi:hypothetical protein